MVRNSPAELPLAASVRYTENGVPLKLGTGLWQSLNGLREYGVALADTQSGQGGWFGALDERTLFAMLALRFKVSHGLISEIEVVVARPQAPAVGQTLATATFTMFTPPLEHDLAADAFSGRVPAAFLTTAKSPSDLADAGDRLETWLIGKTNDSAKAFAVRSNGHTVQSPAGLPDGVTGRGHRVWLTDDQLGLVLDLTLRDNTGAIRGAPANRSAPWTDIHARLIKVDAGSAIQSEGLVVRVPFGQGSGWRT
jgi:hypothetical protein